MEKIWSELIYKRLQETEVEDDSESYLPVASKWKREHLLHKKKKCRKKRNE